MPSPSRWRWLVLVSTLIIPVLLAIPLIVYAVGTTSTRLVADDYCLLVTARQYGVLGNVSWWYTHWIGRFSTIFLISVGMLLQQPLKVALIISVYLLLGISLFALVKILIKHRQLTLSARQANSLAAGAAALFIMALIAGALDPFQITFWPRGRSNMYRP